MDSRIQSILDDIQPNQRKEDCLLIFQLMEEITKQKPKIWGKDMLGFGTYTYKTAGGKQGEWFVTGFASRSKYISIYLLAGFEGELKSDLTQLGKHKLGKGCLYINRLADIDLDVLKILIEKSYQIMKERHGLQ